MKINKSFYFGNCVWYCCLLVVCCSGSWLCAAEAAAKVYSIAGIWDATQQTKTYKYVQKYNEEDGEILPENRRAKRIKLKNGSNKPGKRHTTAPHLKKAPKVAKQLNTQQRPNIPPDDRRSTTTKRCKSTTKNIIQYTSNSKKGQSKSCRVWFRVSRFKRGAQIGR